MVSDMMDRYFRTAFRINERERKSETHTGQHKPQNLPLTAAV